MILFNASSAMFRIKTGVIDGSYHGLLEASVILIYSENLNTAILAFFFFILDQLLPCSFPPILIS